jgi:hypothetical protein
MAGYFSYIPNIYVTRLEDDNTTKSSILVKNLFRKSKTRTDLSKYYTLFNPYYVPDGELPWQTATRLYGDPTLEWII